ncbi:MAG: hypothetical protein ACKVWV_03005 [Planctomycetota bacterium]
MAWTTFVIVVALAGAVWSFRAYARAAGRFLREPKFAWTQVPGALWIAMCVWLLGVFFGLSATELLFGPHPHPRDAARTLDRYARGASFLLLYYSAALAIPCVVGTIIQLVRDRFRAAWRPLILMVTPAAGWVGTWMALLYFAQVVHVTD